MFDAMLPRHLARFVLAALSVSVAAGCARRAPDRDVGEAPLRVRVLTVMPVSGRWELAAEQGLGRIAAEFGADVARRRAVNSLQQRALVAEQGDSGVDLVFCVGDGYENAVFSEAPTYPETRFVLLPGRGHGTNVAGIEIVPDGAAWVAGVVAGELSTSNAVGVLRGAGGPWLDHVEAGFIKGFLSTAARRTAIVVSSPEGPWELVERGVTVALHAADHPDAEVYAAAHDAGMLLVVTDAALIDREPDVIAAAMMVDVAEAMVRLTRDVVDGVFSGGMYAFDLGSGVLDVRLNQTMADVNRPAVHDALENARSEVTAGIVEMEGLGF